jgi:hypothetical protein
MKIIVALALLTSQLNSRVKKETQDSAELSNFFRNFDTVFQHTTLEGMQAKVKSQKTKPTTKPPPPPPLTEDEVCIDGVCTGKLKSFTV